MCTYLTEKVVLDGAGKGATGWFRLTDGSVYVDHPTHARYTHTLNIDFLNPAEGPGARVAVELTVDAARQLMKTIEAVLAEADRRGVLESG